jgi:WXG100 family type VII secretion target
MNAIFGAVAYKGERAVANVSLEYSEIEAVASQLRAGQEQIQGELGRLQAAVDNLVSQGFVTQVASERYHASYMEFTSGTTKVIEGLTGLAQWLHTVATTFEETDRQLGGH